MASVIEHYVRVPHLSPQVVSYLCAQYPGFRPLPKSMGMLLEIAPMMQLHAVLHHVLKNASVHPGIVSSYQERGFVLLHSTDSNAIEQAETSLKTFTELPACLEQPQSHTVLHLTNIHPEHARVVNLQKEGAQAVPSQSLYMISCEPAAYAIALGCRIEEQMHARLIECSFVGQTGYVTFCGLEDQITQIIV